MIEKVVEYLYQIPRFARTGGLDETRERLRLLGNPEKTFKYIHVAGTNGKGSTCAYMESILRQMGVPTGLFTSPHLIRINERIRINYEEISDEAFIQAFERVKALVDLQVANGMTHPTFFEFIYLMAMCAFADAGVEYGIIETGLGGRMDLTNAVFDPDLTVITSISFDHTAILGDSLEKIAFEKAGIIKPHVPLIYREHLDEASKVIRNTALEKNAPAISVSSEQISDVQMKEDGIHFSYTSPEHVFTDMMLNTRAVYQTENAALAISAIEQMKSQLCENEEQFYEHIRNGLCRMQWAGRMEQIGTQIYVDGAHNDDGIAALVRSVKLSFGEKGIILVFAVAEDKDYRQMVEHLSHIPNLRGVIVTEINNGRRRDFHEVMKIFEDHWHGKMEGTYNVNEAISMGKQWMGSEDVLLCTGSLYLVGHVKEILGGF